MTVHGINVTTYLRWSLAGVLLILCFTIVYTGFFKPPAITHPLFDANQFPTGIWGTERQDFVFSYYPNITIEIMNDEAEAFKYLYVHLPKGEVYKGFGISQFLSIPQNSQLVVEWKHSGDTLGIQVDIKDSVNTGSNAGEVFSHTLLPPKDQWTITVIPLSGFIRNEYQSQDNPKDGFLNTHPIRSVEFALPPNEDVLISVKKVYFTSESPKWFLITGMALIGGFGLILLIRTSREFFSLMPDERVFSSEVSFRLMYIFMTLAFVYAELYDTVEHDWFVPGCVYSIFYCLLCFHIFLPVRFVKLLPGSFLFLVLFAAGWWFGYPKSSVELLLLLLSTSIPFIQRKFSVILFLTLITTAVFMPALLMYSMPFELQHIIFVYLFFIFVVIFSLGIQQNLLTKLKAENTATMYEELFNHTSDAIFSYYANGMIENVNQGFENLIGKSRNELIGTFIQDWVLLEDQPLLPMNQSIQDDSLRKYDMRFLNHNREVIYTNIIERAKRINREVSSYQVIARDMTKWKQIENLEKEKELAEQSSAFKTKFLSNMTHEIRTPLHGILSALEILSSTKLTEEQDELARIAKSSGKNLLEIVNGILDFAKMESGKFELHQALFNLTQLIHDVIVIVKKQAAEKKLSVEVTLPEMEYEYYTGDSIRIRQILMNLLGNAIKFTEQGSVSLHTFIKDKTSETARFRFEVVDTGIGIAPENLDAVFEVFTQVDSSNTRIYGGTGLGLAICKELVYFMKGEIGVESEVGIGSLFWVEIPLQKETSDSISLFR